MRDAEAYSRAADRSHSVFFNPEMMEFWENKWAFDDACERRWRREQAKKARERELAREKWRREQAEMEAELRRERLAWQKEQERQKQERERRIEQTRQADQDWEASETSDLEQRIKGITKGSYPHTWTAHDLARVLEIDIETVSRALDSMAPSGKLRRVAL
jgi:hypothetical protein